LKDAGESSLTPSAMDRRHCFAAAKGRAMRDRDLLGIAWFCWAVPAVVGVGATILYVLVGESVFISIGLACVPFGIILFLFALPMLATAKTGPRGLLLLLLALNFPLAFVCATIGMATASPFGGSYQLEVVVCNDSDVPIDSAVVTYGKYIGEVRDIPPRTKERIKVKVGYIHQQTDVRLAVHRGENSIRKALRTFDGDDFLGGGFNELSIVAKERSIEWAK
jgi:hypothetical protein